ncbi:MAG: hypothetical protein GY820_29995 [Gammaproteobacteria bacterium]|nr:hypothetical protein [Gammaproteobacteria bacterium]
MLPIRFGFVEMASRCTPGLKKGGSTVRAHAPRYTTVRVRESIRKRKTKKWAAAYKPGKIAGTISSAWLNIQVMAGGRLLQNSCGPLNQSASIQLDVSVARQTLLWGVW